MPLHGGVSVPALLSRSCTVLFDLLWEPRHFRLISPEFRGCSYYWCLSVSVPYQNSGIMLLLCQDTVKAPLGRTSLIAVAYTSLRCPLCSDFHTPVFKQLVMAWVLGSPSCPRVVSSSCSAHKYFCIRLWYLKIWGTFPWYDWQQQIAVSLLTLRGESVTQYCCFFWD